ncbi:hypothetical protein LPB142_04855 [Rhodobacter xanthinilyticus]|uniref:Uncharacterized protein n=1 Tax=Rhodobacter xanthinilyticus TaxID=1850250 RepID=A0A1D9MA63_9RHOB|nr:hypothetical protein [Rhodobacter xanthinilyticus]AOZ68727.1 hypothetical protein LPB142_04855 [Rhodobacter xanthinilyticus]
MTSRVSIGAIAPTTTGTVIGFDEGQLVHGAISYIEPARDELIAVPALSDRVTNWAKSSFCKLSGASLADADGRLAENSFAAGEALFELTSAGALHCAINQSIAAQTHGVEIGHSQEVLDYMAANVGHVFYADFLTAPTSLNAYSATITYTSVGWDCLIGDRNVTDELDLFVGFKIVPSSAVGQRYYRPNAVSSTVLGVAGSNPSTDTRWHFATAREVTSGLDFTNYRASFRWRGSRAWSGGSVNGNVGGQSHVFYSSYIEDLTVSGRPYSSVYAMRAAQIAADFGAGGRYYGESWTNPASVVW